MGQGTQKRIEYLFDEGEGDTVRARVFVGQSNMETVPNPDWRWWSFWRPRYITIHETVRGMVEL